MWRCQGTIDGKLYAIAGCTAFVLKYFLDKFVAFAAYWHLWSDYILHRIHLRVLEHIRTQAEGAVK